jgi:Mrp family chromosome partitioning ATPase
LASYITRTGQKTALIDADLRGSGVSDAIWNGADPTYADLIASGGDWHRVVPLELAQGLHVFPNSRRTTMSPLEILGSRSMEQLIELLRGKYDLIIVDTPPISAFADVEALAEHADSALLVACARNVNRQSLSAAASRLAMHSRLGVAVVLNMVKLKRT